MKVTLNFSNSTRKRELNCSTPPLDLPLPSNSHLWRNTKSGMNKKRNNKKQISLSQSLFRSKPIKKDSSNNSTNSKRNEHYSAFANSQDERCDGSSTPKASNSDDCDDSFDLFLPRKNPPKTTSSQSSFFEVKKRSKYFDGSGELRVPKVIKDDDLELALAVSLQESKGTPVLLKSNKVDGTSKTLKPLKSDSFQPKGKLKKICRQSLLMRRTPADRERIITEKVAIVLMDKGKNVISPSRSSRSNDPFSLHSSHLRKQVYEMKTLWSLAQSDLAQVKLENFFIDVIIHFLPSNCMNDVDCSNPAKALSADGTADETRSAHLQRADSAEDMFDDSGGDDSNDLQSPKRLRPSESLEALGKPEEVHNLSVNKSGEELSLRVDSFDVLGSEVEESGSFGNIENSKISADIKERIKNPNLRIDHNLLQNQMENHLDVLKHYRKLAADMLLVSKSPVSRITEISSGSQRFFVHHCIFEARCPSLLEALEKNPNCLSEYSVEVCEALFAYIYAADVGRCMEMTLELKNDLMKCAKQFNISSLVEVLEAEVFVYDDEDVKMGLSSAEYLSSESFSRHVPDNVESFKIHSTPKEVAVDSDSCSVEEKVDSVGPTLNCNAIEDEDLDEYLKDGRRLSDKPNSNLKAQTNNECSNHVTPLKTVYSSRKSIDEYFQESFPSLTDIGVAFTPPPVVTPKSDHPLEPTPGSSGIVDCVTPGGQLVVSGLATPLPDYDGMVTPDLQAALHKYGIRRGIGRQKAATLLRYIYDQIHPPADHPAVAKALQDVKSSIQKNDESEDDVYSLSSESSGDVQMFEDLGDVESSQPNIAGHDRSGLLQAIGDYIKSNTLLYAEILSYEPIWLNKFHKAVKDRGLKCNKKELMDVLDELGITFRTEQTERQMQRKGSKRKTKRKRK